MSAPDDNQAGERRTPADILSARHVPSRIGKTRRAKKLGLRAVCAIAPLIYRAYMAFVAATSRVDISALERLLEHKRRGDNAIAAILHQDIFITPYLFRGHDILSFTNLGDAGDVMSAIMESCGFRVVRGGRSSRLSRKAPVLREMTDALAAGDPAAGNLVAIAPDGSKGPAGAIDAGLVVFSMRMKAGVYAARVQASRAFYMDTWDRTAIPLPFGSLKLLLDGPHQPGHRPSRDEVESVRLDIEDAFHRVHEDGFRAIGQEPIPPLHRAPPYGRSRRIPVGKRAWQPGDEDRSEPTES